MPRSPVQFQKGQSLAEFTDRYGKSNGQPSSRHAGQGFECPESRAQTQPGWARNVFEPRSGGSA